MSILLVGTGHMGKEYAKVLKAIKLQFFVVGRSKKSADAFEKEMGIPAQSGGLANWLRKNKTPNKAIVAATEDQLGIITRQLIKAGCKEILVEKPGGFDIKDIKLVAAEAKKYKTKVLVGYNRRFYASTLTAREIIKEEGVLSFHFDFTERSYVVETSKQSDKIKRGWFLQNSTHVIDMAFFLGGWPKKMFSLKTDKLKWHPTGAIFAGAGITEKGALFSYHANWKSAGRWSIEVMTPRTKLTFRPLEKLQIQKYGSMAIKDYPLNDDLDLKFKPGLYLQVKSFLENKNDLLTIQEQVKHLKHYDKIKGGV